MERRRLAPESRRQAAATVCALFFPEVLIAGGMVISTPFWIAALISSGEVAAALALLCGTTASISCFAAALRARRRVWAYVALLAMLAVGGIVVTRYQLVAR